MKLFPTSITPWRSEEKVMTWGWIADASDSIQPFPDLIAAVTDAKCLDLKFFQDRWGKTAPLHGGVDHGSTVVAINRSTKDAERFSVYWETDNPNDYSPVPISPKYRALNIGRKSDEEASHMEELQQKVNLLFLDYFDLPDSKISKTYAVICRMMAETGVVAVVGKTEAPLVGLGEKLAQDGFSVARIEKYKEASPGHEPMWIGIFSRKKTDIANDINTVTEDQ